MGRQRKTLQQNSDGRYRVSVKAGSAYALVYLGTRDKSKANLIMEMIDEPLRKGNVVEIKRRVAELSALNDRAFRDICNGDATTRDRAFDDPQYNPRQQDARSYIAGIKDDKDAIANLQDQLDTLTGKTKGRASQRKLSDCLETWAEWKSDVRPQHLANYKRLFNMFVDRVGNLPVNKLTKNHFTDYEKHIKTIQGDRGSKWYQDRLLSVAAVMKLVIKKTDWELPDGLLNWLQFDYPSQVTKSSNNNKPLPVSVYKSLLSVADGWAGMDVETYTAAQPIPAGKNAVLSRQGIKRQAHSKKRAGVMWSAILRLTANCGLDNVDVSRIKWSNLILDGDAPYMDFARIKTEKKTGAIQRITPLLPATVAALLTWQAYEKQGSLVFRSIAMTAYSSAQITKGFNKLRLAAAVPDWGFKHLRNIGPTLGKRNHRDRDERDAFLGHAVQGTSRFYEGDVDQSYLLPLVALIGDAYA